MDSNQRAVKTRFTISRFQPLTHGSIVKYHSNIRLAATLKGISALPVTGYLYTLPSGSYATLIVLRSTPASHQISEVYRCPSDYLRMLQYAIVLLIKGLLLLSQPTEYFKFYFTMNSLSCSYCRCSRHLIVGLLS